MKFSELITKLHSASQPHMLMYIDIRSDCELADVNILASGQSDVQAGTLYFADAGQLTPDTVLPTNLLYYGTLPPELADRLTNSAMIDRGEFAVLFQTVKELLSYQQSDQQLYTQVLYMLCNGAELDRVLTKMTDVIGDLFVVIDSTGKLVAKTKNFYVDYPLWMRSIEQGYCSDILMEYIEDRRRKNEYSLSDKPFTLFCEHMQRYLLCTRIVYDNFMMGYVIIVSKTGMFSAAEQQIIPLLSSSAKERIVKSNNGNWIDYRASQLNNIFADMLAGAQNVDMERRMKLAKLSFPEQKCLAIIRPVYYKEPAYYKSRLIPDMQAIFGKTAFSVVKNDLVLLLTAADGGTITPEQRAALEQYTQGHRLIVGISNCFQANNQLSLHYNMLLQTLQLAKQMRSDQKLFFFSDYVYYALLDQVEDKSLLSFIRHPALDTLIHYDREKSAELYQTLRVFTKCGFNKAHTSERLFLHRNTVNYRIAQIESICGIDLSTTELLFSLQLSFLIDGYLTTSPSDGGRSLKTGPAKLAGPVFCVKNGFRSKMRIGLYDKILTGYCARQTLSISCQANIMGTTEQNRCVSRRDTRTQLRSRPSRRCGALRTAVCPAAGAQDHVNDRKENLDGKDDREYGSQPPWNPDPLPGDFAHHRRDQLCSRICFPAGSTL